MTEQNNEENRLDLPALIEANQALEKKVRDFKRDWYKFYKNISKEKTPQVDGTGKKIIDKRWDGLEYIIDAYMDECLDKHFPGWSWTQAGGLHFTADWVSADGELWIIDEKLIAFGITPPYRKFWGGGSARVQFKSGLPRIPENIVDLDKVIKSAITEAKKYAINRLTGIGDDVYGKRIESEGAGSLEDLITTDDGVAFGRWVADNKFKWNDLFKILEVKSMDEIKDFKVAKDKILKAKGLV